MHPTRNKVPKHMCALPLGLVGPSCLAGKEVRENAVHLFPKSQAGAPHVGAPRLQGAVQKFLGAGLRVCKEAQLCPVQWAAPGWSTRGHTATSALQRPWKQKGHMSGAGTGASEMQGGSVCREGHLCLPARPNSELSAHL